MPQFARVTKDIKIQNKLTRSLGAADSEKREQKDKLELCSLFT